jgi:predicted nucleic acid-binding protein
MEDIPTFNGGKTSVQEFLVKETPIKKYIIDASVVFKWYYKKNEDDIAQAEVIYSLLKTHIYLLLAPELLVYEILNICRLKHEIDIEKVNRIIGELYGTLVIVNIEESLLKKAFKYSRQLDISLYDSIYISLSEKYDVPLITADKKLFDACSETKPKPILVSEFGRSQN